MVSLAAPVGTMPPPPSTPLRRPTVGLKRDSSYLDTDDEAGLSATTKKLRVAFDPNVDVRILEDWNDKSYDLVREEVRLAIESHVVQRIDGKVDHSQYEKLLQVFSSESEAPSPGLLKKYIHAIDTRMASLGECGRLVTAVLGVSWLGRDESFVALFAKFLYDLCSAHAKFVLVVLQRLVANFARLPASQGKLSGEQEVPRSRMFLRLHFVLKTLLRQIPSTSSVLMRVLKLEYPNDIATTRSYLQYQRHLLRLAEELPELKAEILALIVQRLVDMDVQIQQDIEDLEDDSEERLLQRPRVGKDVEVTGESDDSDSDSESESEETTTEEELRMRELCLKVARMDGTMDLLFEYYTPLLEDGTPAASNDAYQQLLSHFRNLVLPNRCRHSQFLLFHFAQTSTEHTSVFAQECLRLALQNSGTGIQRLTASAYLGSFIARGAHVPSQSVREIFEVLCQFLDDMRQRYEPNCRGPDRRNYSLYYAIAQALLYIFCYRWRDLVTGSTTPDLDDSEENFNEDDILAEGRDLAWLAGIKDTLSRNIYSRLNPLKVCSHAIVTEFAKLAFHLRFLYVFPLLESNKRVRLGQTFAYYGSAGLVDVGRRETAWDRKTGEAHHQLEAYFPFDPYCLPVSKRWVEGEYNLWKVPRGMRKEEDEDEDEDGEDEEEGEDEEDASSEEESEEESVVSEVGEEEQVGVAEGIAV